MLKISLKKGEKLVLNGAVLRAAARTELYLENDAAVLRGRDVMAADEADTPARRLYFACMMAYLDPKRRANYQDDILTLLADLLAALESPEAKGWCMTFARHVGAQDFYRALAICRSLMDYEAAILAASGVQTVAA